MARRPLLLPAALAALLAGGCDFVDNLFEEKKLDRAVLTLQLQDAWLGKGLTGCECSAPDIPLTRADDSGKIEWRDAPTGGYSVACTCPGYYPRRLPVNLGAGQAFQEALQFARRGDDWYPDDPFVQPNILFMEGNFRYPGKIRLSALPFDTARQVFRYEWVSNLSKANLEKSGAGLVAKVDSFPEAQTDVDFTLKVIVTLADTSYELAPYSQTYSMVTNLLPTLVIKAYRGSEVPLKVGCQADGDYVEIAVDGDDPDGECKEVRITSKGPSFGNLDTTVLCVLNKPVLLPVNSHVGLPAQTVKRDNEIFLTAVDDNGRTFTQSVFLTTLSNLHPAALIEHQGAPPKVYSKTQQNFLVKAWDRDGRVYSINVDWGDKSGSSLNPQVPDTVSWRFSHSYSEAGAFTIKAKVMDGCQGAGEVSFPVNVVNNSPPKVSLKSPDLVPGTKDFQVGVEATDTDIGDGLDSLNVLLKWGDGDTTIIQGKAHEQIGTTRRHSYSPDSTRTHYLIEVIATDAFGNSAIDTLRITRAQAGQPDPP